MQKRIGPAASGDKLSCHLGLYRPADGPPREEVVTAATSNYPSTVQIYDPPLVLLARQLFEPGQDAFWLHLLSSRGVISHVVAPTSILVTRGAQRGKTNRLDAVRLLHVLALKVHQRTRCLPAIVVPSVEEEDALHPPGSLGRGRRSVPGTSTRSLEKGPGPPAADP